MPGLNPYLVGYVFRLLWRECHPSDLPESLITRVVGVQELVPLYEDATAGIREYKITAKLEAESCERAVELVHRWFAHLPGCTVMRFACQPLTPGSEEKSLTSDSGSGDLFAGKAGSAPLGKGAVIWHGEFSFVLHYVQNDAANICSRAGFEKVRVLENIGAAVVVAVDLNFDCNSESDQDAENYGWEFIGGRLGSANWEKRAATLSHKLP